MNICCLCTLVLIGFWTANVNSALMKKGNAQFIDSSILHLPGTIALSAEKRLIKDLIDTYKQAGVVGRPVRNTSDAILVHYGLALIQILSLDEKNQVLTISSWSRYQWQDYLLSWNKSDYDGVDTVRVPAKDIWLPDIILYNYADDRLEEKRDAMAVVSSDGTVGWIPPAIYKSSCSIDITNFPFDSQICHLKFGSWSYDGLKQDLTFYQDLPEIDLNDYVPSNEWDILGHPARKNVIRYPCCTEPFPDLTFTLVLQRKVAFYSYILILPCVLLSLLTMVLFWLPPESPAKMQLGMNIFVAFFLLLLLLTENTPPAASSIPLIGINIFVAFFVLLLLLADSTPPAARNIPLIGAYYCLNMIMITLSTFLAVIVIHLYFRGPRTNRVPRWLKKIVLGGMARMVCMMNYIPKESKPPMYEALKHVDPRLGKEFKKMRIKELKYNKYQVRTEAPYNSSSVIYNTPATNASHPPTMNTSGHNTLSSLGDQKPHNSQVNHAPHGGVPQSFKASQTIVHTSGQTNAVYNQINPPSSPPLAHNCKSHAGNGLLGNASDIGSTLPRPDPSPDMSPLHLHQSLESDVKEIRRFIKTLIYKQKHEEHMDKIRGEWRSIALVLDRLFFFFYVLSIIVSLATIFPRAA